MSNEENEPKQEAKEMNNATADSFAGLSVFDEQDVDYVTLDRVLSKMLVMMDQPWPGKEKIPPLKLNREHVDFLVRLNRVNEFNFIYFTD